VCVEKEIIDLVRVLGLVENRYQCHIGIVALEICNWGETAGCFVIDVGSDSAVYVLAAGRPWKSRNTYRTV
jgi:hypothetical protein